MKQLLKFITCGSVDDGKSTLIGHILYDAKLLYADQEKALQLDSKVGSRGGNIDYSLLLDGLTEEREQGITIDVAYRYFTTDRRSFIVADTPGHEQYTRNMAVGASFADLSIILLDAEKGVLVQTRRHARICSLMGIHYFVFAVNKMDLVGYSREVFEKIAKDIEALQKVLGIKNVLIIPVSATEGDNVNKKSNNIPWYKGPALLEYLEEVDTEENVTEKGFYLPVQRVCRPDHTFRGFQGQIESGSVSIGDEIQILPAGEKAKVKEILRTDERVEKAYAGQPVTLTLDREVDISRGDVITKDADFNSVNLFTADILWMDNKDLVKGTGFFVKTGTALIPCTVTEILYRTDVNTGEKIPAGSLTKNELGQCRISLADRITADRFENHKALGELILIDRVSFQTCACGVIRETEHDVDFAADAKALRERFLLQNAAAVEFVYNGEESVKLLEKVEKKLIVSGNLVYFFNATSLSASENDIKTIEVTVENLKNAGLIVLLLVTEGQKKKLKLRERFFRYSLGNMGEDEESITAFVGGIASPDTHKTINADFI